MNLKELKVYFELKYEPSISDIYEPIILDICEASQAVSEPRQ
jgi:hypothetical protein